MRQDQASGTWMSSHRVLLSSDRTPKAQDQHAAREAPDPGGGGPLRVVVARGRRAIFQRDPRRASGCTPSWSSISARAMQRLHSSSDPGLSRFSHAPPVQRPRGRELELHRRGGTSANSGTMLAVQVIVDNRDMKWRRRTGNTYPCDVTIWVCTYPAAGGAPRGNGHIAAPCPGVSVPCRFPRPRLRRPIAWPPAMTATCRWPCLSGGTYCHVHRTRSVIGAERELCGILPLGR